MTSNINTLHNGYYLVDKYLKSTDNIYIYLHFQKVKQQVTNILEQAHEQALKETKARYSKNYMAAIKKLDPKTLTLVDTAIGHSQQTVSQIDKVIKTAMAEALKKNASYSTLSANTDLVANSYHMAKIAADSLKNTTEHIQAMNNIFQAVSNASEMLDTADKDALQAVLGAAMTESNIDIGGLYNKLVIKENMILVNKDLVESIITNLNTLSHNIQNSQFDKDLVKSVQANLNNIFGTNFQEAIGAINLAMASGKAYDEAVKSLSDVLIGKSSHATAKADDKLKDQIKTRMSSFGNNSNIFKTDAGGVAMDFKFNDDSYQVTLGYSIKLTDAQDIASKGSVTLANEAHLQNRLSQLIAKYERQEDISWAVYNALASFRDKKERGGYDLIKKVILARTADSVISGLGINKDFSQFLYINGQLFSIFDIINKILPNYTGIGDNEAFHVTLNGVTQVGQLSANEERGEFVANLEKARARVIAQNNLIKNRVGYTVTLHTDKLIQAFNSSK